MTAFLWRILLVVWVHPDVCESLSNHLSSIAEDFRADIVEMTFELRIFSNLS